MKIDCVHHTAHRYQDAMQTERCDMQMPHMDLVRAIAEVSVPSTIEPDPWMHNFLNASQGNVPAFFELLTYPPIGRDPNTLDSAQHGAFEVKDRGELLALIAHPKVSVVPLSCMTNRGVIHSIYFFDPSGHRLELACPASDAAFQLKRLELVK
jgi:hypothetical protein